MSSAFRQLRIRPDQWKYLIIMAKSPLDGKIYFFVDKCLPFGAAISCSHFQRFSDTIAHIVGCKVSFFPINYLDDFLFVGISQEICDGRIQVFLDICGQIKFPVAMEKTKWSDTLINFLGFLIDTIRQRVSVPADKIAKVQELVQQILHSKSVMVKSIQKLCGHLNFLCRCIVPGRAFT